METDTNMLFFFWMVEFRRSSCKNACVFVPYKDTFTKNFLQICLASVLYGIVEYGLSREFLLAFDKQQWWLLSSTCVVMQLPHEFLHVFLYIWRRSIFLTESKGRATLMRSCLTQDRGLLFGIWWGSMNECSPLNT